MAAGTGRGPTRIIEHENRAPSLGRRLVHAGLAAFLVAVGPYPGKDEGSARTVSAGHEEGRIGARALLTNLYHRFSDDRILAISAGVTFYVLLAIFPAIAALVSIYGIFADANTIHREVASMGPFLPGGAVQIVDEQIRRVASNGHRTLGLAAIAGFLFSLWSANAGVKAMFDALNIVHREQETRSFLRLNMISLLFTIGALFVVLLAIGTVIAVPALADSPPREGILQAVFNIGRWPFLWASIALAIALLYHFGPSRNNISWRWITWGSGLASLLWLVASIAFSWYTANFGSYNRTYGSLGAVIGFMTWIWISAIVVLMGEELNEAIRDLRHPHTPQRPHPFGVKGRCP